MSYSLSLRSVRQKVAWSNPYPEHGEPKVAFFHEGAKRVRCTFVLTFPDGTKIYRFWDTDIVTSHADGSLSFRLGGWWTFTTRDRVRRILRSLGNRIHLGSGRKGWYLVLNQEEYGVPLYSRRHLPRNLRHVYLLQDGMRIWPNRGWVTAPRRIERP